MDDDQFLWTVRQALGGDEAAAERAIRATLGTLGERIGRDEARHLVSVVGPRLGGWRFAPGAPQPFGVDEFVRRVANRERVGLGTAERHARMVFTAWGQAMPDPELAHLRARLSKDFASLLPRGPSPVAPSAEDVVVDVAKRAGMDTGTAARAHPCRAADIGRADRRR